MLSIHGSELVLWIHILAACIWIGGQATLAMLVPLLRREPSLLAAAARRYQVVAWTAFAVLVLTGIANMHNAGISLTDLHTTAIGRTLGVKLLFVLLSGLAAAFHAFVVAPRTARQPTPLTRALSGLLGILALLAAVIAALYGVLIAEA